MNHVQVELGRNRRASVTDCKDGVAVLTFYADGGNHVCVSLHMSPHDLRNIAEVCTGMAEQMDPGDTQAAHEPFPNFSEGGPFSSPAEELPF